MYDVRFPDLSIQLLKPRLIKVLPAESIFEHPHESQNAWKRAIATDLVNVRFAASSNSDEQSALVPELQQSAMQQHCTCFCTASLIGRVHKCNSQRSVRQQRVGWFQKLVQRESERKNRLKCFG